MKITVTAARRDEILQRKAAYERDKAERKARHDAEYARYEAAQNAVFAEVENAIRDSLGDQIGKLNIQIDTRYGKLLYVEVGNDKGGPRQGAALTWRYTVTIDKSGEVTKESGSWSGLEAVTMEQVEDLKQTVRQLEILNSIDWATLLNRELPNWQDYVTQDDPSYDRNVPDFDRELLEADIEDTIGANVLIKSHEGRAYRGDVYFHILRDSGSQYAVEELPAYAVDSILNGHPLGDYSTIQELVDKYANTIRIRKTNFFNMIYTPLQTQNY